jgi:hypothetical protein
MLNRRAKTRPRIVFEVVFVRNAAAKFPSINVLHMHTLLARWTIQRGAMSPLNDRNQHLPQDGL